MKYGLRILIFMLTLTCMSAWSQSAMAARLASVDGEAGAQEVCKDSEFKLGEETDLQISYNFTKNGDNCNAQVRIYRKLNGRWRVVNVVHQTDKTERGSHNLTLPAGDYKIEVVATDIRFSVNVDN